MTIYIVLRNGKVDEVFDNEAAAQLHRKNLTKLWAMSELVIKEIKSL
jgi:hypothetical protein